MPDPREKDNAGARFEKEVNKLFRPTEAERKEAEKKYEYREKEEGEQARMKHERPLC